MLTIENKQDRFARLQALGPDGSLDEFTKKMVRNFINQHGDEVSAEINQVLDAAIVCDSDEARIRIPKAWTENLDHYYPTKPTWLNRVSTVLIQQVFVNNLIWYLQIAINASGYNAFSNHDDYGPSSLQIIGLQKA